MIQKKYLLERNIIFIHLLLFKIMEDKCFKKQKKMYNI